ncbi:uncharacterized protein MYCGRDRAFT_97945 [Zymoseptoria tritici IPO323]|uniref:Uncharacterized protein n=1 Tax=Zymoseptoria tritici (strain CBS 115943 / IPO323) TaxID=336722 RepID=F9XRV3_ZYMTI|nr:uncharacterized protein MYCGRDRAFT_97945 [Zymoseptoria tritici IPO323]EGP82031.1 hypothetical protein MYCGRDRAFT_97945 [Zymoseptoria tritici IPO323]
MPRLVPPAELPASLVDAFAELDMSNSKNNSSHSHPHVKREEQPDQWYNDTRHSKSPIHVVKEDPVNVVKEDPINVVKKDPVNVAHLSSIKKEHSKSPSFIKEKPANIINEQDLIYSSSSSFSPKVGWYFAHRLDLDRARKLGSVMLPDGTKALQLRAEDVAALRQAGWMALRGIAIVYYDNGMQQDVVKKEEMEGEGVDLEAMGERLQRLKQ